jgi:hypothetical protein
MNAMTCNDVAEQIELFASGECDPPIAAAIRRHMTGCARCTKSEIEARQFLEMMDLRHQEPDRLQRLLDRIGEEEKAARWGQVETCATGRPALRMAASILLPIGIGIWLTPPAESPAPGRAGTELTIALLADRSVRGQEKLVPAPPIDVLPAEYTLTFAFEPGGQTSKAYRAKLVEAAHKGELPAPPEVDLLLQISNPTNQPIRLRFDDPRAELRFSLTGPGVLRVNAPNNVDPFAGLRILETRAGSSEALPIRRLMGGSRQQPAYWYWTEPGDYRLRVLLRAPVESGGKTTLTTVSGPTISIRVK